jgi:alpha-L-rhamnosidase
MPVQRALLVVLHCAALACAAPTVTGLRTEYERAPLGIGARTPRFSWRCEDARRGSAQAAYQVLVAASETALAADRGDRWDSGKVASAQSQFVPYGGPALTARTRLWWKVRVWDQRGEPSAWSTPAWFETGLLKPEAWTAQWIGLGLKTTVPTPTPTPEPPRKVLGFGRTQWIWTDEANPPGGPRFFRKLFHLPADIGIRRAEARLTVDNFFVLYLNGEEVAKTDPQGESWHRPVTVNLASKLRAGPNVLAIRGTNEGPGAAGVLFRLELDLNPGPGAQVVESDRTWVFSRTEVTGWQSPTFDDKGWAKARELGQHGVQPWGALDGSAPALPAMATPAAPPPGPCPHLRRAFTVTKPLARARLYATALGLYELRLNGQPVGDAVLAPDWTDYRRRVQYQTYDVTAQVRQGDNVLGALLGDGWYCGKVGLGGRHRYGQQPLLKAQLMLDYADGSQETIATGDGWKVTAGPYLTADLLDGVSYDARRELPGWDAPGYDDSKWPPAGHTDPAMGALEEPTAPPVRVLAELKPKSVAEPKPGRWTFDLGQNMVGFARLKVKAPAGTTLTLRFAEMLNPDNTIYTANLRGAKCTDTYVCKGGGEEVWQPRFTFRGFRYVEVAGLPGKPDADAITGVVIGSDIPRSGELTCSDARLNQLQSNIVWGQRGNFVSVPTDCPQRDERLGWTGDAQVFVRTATFNNQVGGFFGKWLVDLDDAQGKAGDYPDVAPRVAAGSGTAAWGDAGVVCPWVCWQVYGDRRFLEDHFAGMVRWVEYCRANSKDLLRPAKGYGDWLAIGANTPKDLLGTAWFAYSTKLTAQAACVLGKDDEARRYEALFSDIAKAFCQAYLDPTGRLKGGSQTGYLLALRFGLLPENQRAAALGHLVADIEQRGHRLSTGFVGVGHLLPTLSEHGRTDLAWKLLAQDEFPSWLFSVKHGATTIWERWNGWTPEKGFETPGMNSFNHYSFGACGEWMQEHLLGIAPDPTQPGYRHILVAPRPGGGVTSAKGWYDSGYGRIGVSWALAGGAFSLDLSVPANTSATVTLPVTDRASVREGDQPAEKAEGVTFVAAGREGVSYRVGAGTYRFMGR